MKTIEEDFRELTQDIANLRGKKWLNAAIRETLTRNRLKEASQLPLDVQSGNVDRINSIKKDVHGWVMNYFDQEVIHKDDAKEIIIQFLLSKGLNVVKEKQLVLIVQEDEQNEFCWNYVADGIECSGEISVVEPNKVEVEFRVAFDVKIEAKFPDAFNLFHMIKNKAYDKAYDSIDGGLVGCYIINWLRLSNHDSTMTISEDK